MLCGAGEEGNPRRVSNRDSALPGIRMGGDAVPLLDRVRAELVRHGMVRTGDRVIVAVSGGPDSVALVHVLHRLAPEWGLSLHLFHMDHALRGEASRADAAYVAELARRLSLPLTTVVLEPGELEREPGSLEDNARRRRYAEIRRIAGAIGAQRVATGHSRNDQAETVLMRLLRGSGTTGLAGIPPVREEGGLVIIRPLLTSSRAEIEEYCRTHKLNPRLDASNIEQDFLRNRIRNELLPLLEGRYHGAVVDNLSQVAELLREEDRLLAELARQASARCGWREERMPSGAYAVELDGSRLAQEPVALARRVVRMAVQRVAGADYAPGLPAVNRALELAGREDGSHRLDLPWGVRMTVAYGRCRFAPAEAESAPGHREWKVAFGGETAIPELGLCVYTEVLPASAATGREPPDEAWFDRDRLPGPLAIRLRQPGDRIWPVGMEGSKKLQDILVDAKVPRAERDRLPLLVAGDAVLWVPGVRRDRRYRPDAGTRTVLRVVLRRQQDGSVAAGMPGASGCPGRPNMVH